MTDVQHIERPTSAETATPRRRRRTRTEGAAAAPPTPRRRPRLKGPELVESLRESVEQLLRENRSLKRQLTKAEAGGTSTAAGAEKTLRSLQRKVARAMSSEAPRRRTRQPSANGRRRRRSRNSSA